MRFDAVMPISELPAGYSMPARWVWGDACVLRGSRWRMYDTAESRRMFAERFFWRACKRLRLSTDRMHGNAIVRRIEFAILERWPRVRTDFIYWSLYDAKRFVDGDVVEDLQLLRVRETATKESLRELYERERLVKSIASTVKALQGIDGERV